MTREQSIGGALFLACGATLGALSNRKQSHKRARALQLRIAGANTRAPQQYGLAARLAGTTTNKCAARLATRLTNGTDNSSNNNCAADDRDDDDDDDDGEHERFSYDYIWRALTAN